MSHVALDPLVRTRRLAASLAPLWLVGCATATNIQNARDGTTDASVLPDVGGLCGNGLRDPGEECDDGNTVDGDACRGDCGQDYTLCGNGQRDPGEECDDGNREGGDGCDAWCREVACDAVTCPGGCCDAQGRCQYGTQDEVCGASGAACEPCTLLGQVCQAQACADPGACAAGETQPCGNCGERPCGSGGIFGACEGQGACPAGLVQITGSCGQCGTLQRTCQAGCTWSGLACEGEGVCTPGERELGASCGQCAREERTCQGDCRWSDWTCVSASECTPGLTQTGGACGNCGHEERTCQGDCTWPAWSCVGEGTCAPGASQDCNDCGSRTCLSSCTWDTTCLGTRSCGGAATCDANGWCQSPCGNGVCDVGEDKFSCAADCPTFWCDTNPAVNNMCHFAAGSVGLPMTQCGGYCDPNCNGVFDDADWNAGWYEFCQDRCPGTPGC